MFVVIMSNNNCKHIHGTKSLIILVGIIRIIYSFYYFYYPFSQWHVTSRLLYILSMPIKWILFCLSVVRGFTVSCKLSASGHFPGQHIIPWPSHKANTSFPGQHIMPLPSLHGRHVFLAFSGRHIIPWLNIIQCLVSGVFFPFFVYPQQTPPSVCRETAVGHKVNSLSFIATFVHASATGILAEK